MCIHVVHILAMADLLCLFSSILALDAMQDVLLQHNRHPVLIAFDIASLGLVGVDPHVLKLYWKYVEKRLEAALYNMSPQCQHAFVSSPTQIIPGHALGAVYALDSTQLSKLARDMGVTKKETSAETLLEILKVNDSRLILQKQTRLSTKHAMLFKHIRDWRVTKTTAVREWKVSAQMIDSLQGESFKNPHYSTGPAMTLYKFSDVVKVSKRANSWIFTHPSRSLSYPGLKIVHVPTPSGRKRGRVPTTREEVEEDALMACQKKRERQIAKDKLFEEQQRQLDQRRREEQRMEATRFGTHTHPEIPAEIIKMIVSDVCPVCNKTCNGVRGVFDHVRNVHFRSDSMDPHGSTRICTCLICHA